jgi:hypothetical protein
MFNSGILKDYCGDNKNVVLHFIPVEPQIDSRVRYEMYSPFAVAT